MQNEFKKDFFDTRDEILSNIKENPYNWNKFITYWAKILDKYSVDNVFNLYSYNPTGRIYYTFDEWNNKNIDRRIKPKSKGIPILVNDHKTYVFEIKQTYGRDYKEWSYRHYIDKEILLYYQTKNDITNDVNISLNENFYNTFKEISKNNILNSYYLGLAGFTKFQQKKQEELLPLYLKKPQAQRQLEEKSKAVKIRPMTLQDLEQISPILVTDFDAFWKPSVLEEELKFENSSYLVAILNDEIVGFAGIKNVINQADIMNVVVKKNFRNQGIGSLLLKNLINLAKECNISTLTLEVMEENYPAIHLYKKFRVWTNFGSKKLLSR